VCPLQNLPRLFHPPPRSNSRCKEDRHPYNTATVPSIFANQHQWSATELPSDAGTVKMYSGSGSPMFSARSSETFSLVGINRCRIYRHQCISTASWLSWQPAPAKSGRNNEAIFKVVTLKFFFGKFIFGAESKGSSCIDSVVLQRPAMCALSTRNSCVQW